MTTSPLANIYEVDPILYFNNYTGIISWKFIGLDNLTNSVHYTYAAKMVTMFSLKMSMSYCYSIDIRHEYKICVARMMTYPYMDTVTKIKL